MAQARALVERERLPATFAGFLNQSEIVRAYAAADCLVLPSDAGETWGLVVNEAMACGIPAIVSDQVGCGSDLVTDGVTGATFPMGDVDALARCLIEFSADPKRLRRMGAAAHEQRDFTLFGGTRRRRNDGRHGRIDDTWLERRCVCCTSYRPTSRPCAMAAPSIPSTGSARHWRRGATTCMSSRPTSMARGDSAVPLGRPVDMDGVKVWYFPSRWLRRLYWSPPMARALKREVGGFELVHLHSVFLWPTWAAARAARRLGVPYVLSPRGMLVKDLVRRKSRWLKRAWIRLVERNNMAHAAAIHVTSETEATELSRFAFAMPRMITIPNGLSGPGARGSRTRQPRCRADSRAAESGPVSRAHPLEEGTRPADSGHGGGSGRAPRDRRQRRGGPVAGARGTGRASWTARSRLVSSPCRGTRRTGID